MTISQLFCPVFSKSIPLLIISVVLTACSTEENFTDSSTLDTGLGVTQGITPEPILEPIPVPVTNLSVSSSSIVQGQSVTLSWSSTDADSCTAFSSWSGARSTNGYQVVSPTVTSIYTLTCNSNGGIVSDSVAVTVNQPTAQVPAANLSVSASRIDKGQSATLSWSSTNATGCTASGAWGGSRNISGIVTVSPVVTSTYTLTCNGAGGSASASPSVTVTVNQPPPSTQNINLSWIPPVEREDGTPIKMAEIAGYRVYYGSSKGNYTNNVDIADRTTMQATLSNLTTGTYYIVMTTYDMDGRESVFSPVVTKSI